MRMKAPAKESGLHEQMYRAGLKKTATRKASCVGGKGVDAPWIDILQQETAHMGLQIWSGDDDEHSKLEIGSGQI